MSRTAHFKVDPKLTQVLGENYASSEKALKELIDNAWDAEASEVHVTVPNILTDSPIIVQDDGRGMETAELEADITSSLLLANFAPTGSFSSPSLKKMPHKSSGTYNLNIA